MPTTPFYLLEAGGTELASGDPARLQRRIQWQIDDNLPSTEPAIDYIGNGGPIAPTPLWVERLGIRGSGQAQAQLVGKYNVTSGQHGMGDLDPNALAQIYMMQSYLQRFADVVRESVTYGAELLSASGWTSTGWTGDWATGWDHTTGNTSVLSNTVAGVVDTEYLITYTVSGRTAGSFTLAFGGVSSAAGLTATGTFTPTATSTGAFSVTPTTDFDGAIVLSIVAVSSIAFRHLQSEGAENLAPAWMQITSDDAKGLPTLFQHVRTQGFNLSAGPGTNVNLLFNLVGGAFDFHGAVSESTGTGEVLPNVGGVWAGNLSDDGVDDDLYIETITTTSAGVTVVACKRGLAGTLGPNITAVHGSTGVGNLVGNANRYYILYGADGLKAGDEAEAVWFQIPEGAVWTDGDTFKIPKRRDHWTASFESPVPLPEVNAKFYLAGQRVAIHGGWQLSGAVQVTRLDDTGGRQAITTDRFGDSNTTLQVTRRHNDNTIEKANLLGTALTAVITIYSTVMIGDTLVPFGFAAVMPYLVIGGTPAYSVAIGGQNRDEQVTLTCREMPPGSTPFVWSGRNHTDSLTVYWWNGFSSATP